MEPVSKSGLEHTDALMLRPLGLWCACPEGFGLEDVSWRGQGRSDCWGTVTSEQSQEMGSCVADLAHRSQTGAAC